MRSNQQLTASKTDDSMELFWKQVHDKRLEQANKEYLKQFNDRKSKII